MTDNTFKELLKTVEEMIINKEKLIFWSEEELEELKKRLERRYGINE